VKLKNLKDNNYGECKMGRFLVNFEDEIMKDIETQVKIMNTFHHV